MHVAYPRSRSTQLRHTRRLINNFDRVLGRMRREGLSLCLQHGSSQPMFSLSDGESVTRDVATLLINSSNVVPADLGLFPGMPGQTWRFVQ